MFDLTQLGKQKKTSKPVEIEMKTTNSNVSVQL